MYGKEGMDTVGHVERSRSHTFITVYCCNCSTLCYGSSSLTVPNLEVKVYHSGCVQKKHGIGRARYYLSFQAGHCS